MPSNPHSFSRKALPDGRSLLVSWRRFAMLMARVVALILSLCCARSVIVYYEGSCWSCVFVILHAANREASNHSCCGNDRTTSPSGLPRRQPGNSKLHFASTRVRYARSPASSQVGQMRRNRRVGCDRNRLALPSGTCGRKRTKCCNQSDFLPFSSGLPDILHLLKD
jgi:hypothetical protein